MRSIGLKSLLTPLAAALLVWGVPEAAQAQMTHRAVGQLCGYISARTPDINPNSPNSYAYQTSLYWSADVNPDRDDPAEVRRKLQLWWSIYDSQMTCNSVNFNVPNGSVLKFAISRRFDEFIDDVAAWRVDMNIVDRTDNRTVLDYIEDETVRLAGTAAERTLRRYYRTLRDTGARHRRELTEVRYTGRAGG